MMIYRLWKQTWNFGPKIPQIRPTSAHQHEFAELGLQVWKAVKPAYPSFDSAAFGCYMDQ